MGGRNKSECERTPEGFRIAEGVSVMDGMQNEITAITSIGLRALRGHKLRKGKEPIYENTPEDFERFCNDIEGYFEKLNEVNSSGECRVVPDVESLASWLGMTRKTLLTYQRERGGAWTEEIELAKQVIIANKKQLLLSARGNAVGLIFDLINSSPYYRNVSEYHLENEEPVGTYESPEQRARRLADKYRVAPEGDTGRLDG